MWRGLLQTARGHRQTEGALFGLRLIPVESVVVAPAEKIGKECNGAGGGKAHSAKEPGRPRIRVAKWAVVAQAATDELGGLKQIAQA